MNSIRAGMLILTLILGQHIVQPGEWLYSIGRAYGVGPVAIATASGITLNSTLHPGQVLVIPDTYKQLPPGPTAARQFGTAQVVVPVDDPLPRITPLPVIVAAPTVTTPAPVVQTRSVAAIRSPGQAVTIKYSWYNPELGGVNCAVFRNGVCVSNMANGQPWLPWMYKACACPPEWPFETVVYLEGRPWICKDRGGAVVYDWQGIPFVDFLTRYPTHNFGTHVQVNVVFP